MIFLGAIAIGLYFLLPTIIELLKNTIYAIILGVIAFALLYVLFDKRFRTLVWYGYKSMMKKITGVFVEVDTIGIIETYVDDLEANHEQMGIQLEAFNGSKTEIQRKIGKTKAECEDNTAKAGAAEKMMKEAKDATMKSKWNGQYTLAARQAGRLETSLKSYMALYNKMDLMHKGLERAYENSAIWIQDTRNEIQLKKDEYEIVKKGHTAIKSMMSALNGDPDKRAIFEQALDFMETDVADKVGQMDTWLKRSASLMDSIDLDNAANLEKGIKMLDEWTSKGDLNNMFVGQQKSIVAANFQVMDTVSQFKDSPIASASKYIDEE